MMDDKGATVTTTGLDELRRLVEDLPEDIVAGLRDTARDSARRIHDRAQHLLREQQKTSAHALADAIKIEEDDANKLVAVVSYPPIGQPTSVTIWNEHGTVHMPARPYMRPAAEEERSRYVTAVEHAIDRVISKVP